MRTFMGFLTPYLLSIADWPADLLTTREVISRMVSTLGGGLPSETVGEMVQVLEVVNSYSSNRMEGNPTRIGDIFNARDGHFIPTAIGRNFQLEHLAHLQVSAFIRESVPQGRPCSREFLREIHRQFYTALPEELRFATLMTGEKVPIRPGEWRTAPATVGRFQTPTPDQIDAIMEEFENAYHPDRVEPVDQLGALAASHHRFLWAHPFSDGNGRVARLMSDALALRWGVGGKGLYSISRGLARRRADYDSALAQADASRLNDLDGRGNLSRQGLIAFTRFYLETMADQIQFIGGLLDFSGLQGRWETFLQSQESAGLLSRSEAAVLRPLLRQGWIRRGDIQILARLERRQATNVAAKLLKGGWVQSDSVKGPLSLRIGKEAARALFPEFFE
jgi:Fic family protein